MLNLLKVIIHGGWAIDAIIMNEILQISGV